MDNFGYFSDDDDILFCPDFIKIRILLTILRKQDAYIATLESNIATLITTGKQCSGRLKQLEPVHRRNVNLSQENKRLMDVNIKNRDQIEYYKATIRLLREEIKKNGQTGERMNGQTGERTNG